MQFKTLALALFASVAVAQFNVCFDDFDCILAGGGKCNREGINILGSCVKDANAPALPIPSGIPAGGIPTGLPAGGLPTGLPAGGLPTGIPSGFALPSGLPSFGRREAEEVQEAQE